MNSQLQFLIELQRLDRRIFEIQDQQRKTPEQIKQAQAPLLEASSRLKALRETSEVLSKEHRSSERDLTTQEEHIKKIRGRLTELKTNKEYQAHLYEIELARKKKDSLEETVLGVLERIEQNQNEIKEIEQIVREADVVFEREKSRLEELTATLEQELTSLNQQQKDVANLLDASEYTRYMRLRTVRKGFAVAQIREGACSGCRLQLPPQLVAEIKRGEQLLSCSYCHRILYWEEVTRLEESSEALSAPSGQENVENQG